MSPHAAINGLLRPSAEPSHDRRLNDYHPSLGISGGLQQQGGPANPVPGDETPNTDAESIPRSRRQDKGKERAVSFRSEDEEMPDIVGSVNGSVTPVRHESDGVSPLIWPANSPLLRLRVLISLPRAAQRLSMIFSALALLFDSVTWKWLTRSSPASVHSLPSPTKPDLKSLEMWATKETPRGWDLESILAGKRGRGEDLVHRGRIGFRCVSPHRSRSDPG